MDRADVESHTNHTVPERRRTAEFVRRGSVVRRIWGDGDLALVVFAGSAAEFALNRDVDWLFFTGELPRDPIGRLFSTAAYTKRIVFADAETAARTFARIRAIHGAVERERDARIPDRAHRDVLYMLIDYSERAHELFVGPLGAAEREELYDVFRRVGEGLGIPELPRTYGEWREDRRRHLVAGLVPSEGTRALYARYREELGAWRYRLLLGLQSMLVPAHVRRLLGLRSCRWLRALGRLHPLLVRAGLRPWVRRLLMPARYLEAARGLDHVDDDVAPASLAPRTRPRGVRRRRRAAGVGGVARG